MLFLIFQASGVLAMSSANYELSWFTPLSGSGGSEMSSTNYSAYSTIGQTAIGVSTSTNYSVGLGFWYWYGLLSRGPLYLPIIMR